MMDLASARQIIAWTYAPPYDLYNMVADDEDAARFLADPANQYHVLTTASGELFGFCCFGADATVPGGDYHGASTLDIGYGMHPGRVGRGLGYGFVASVLELAICLHRPERLRTTVATFNSRSRRVCERHGFMPIQTFTSRTEHPLAFVIMVRQAAV